MKNIIVFIVLCCALAVGCKTKKSHVQKSSLDSSEIKREQSNIDIVAVSAKVTNTSLSTDSNWNNAIRLINFTGTIYTDGKVEGSADQADVSQSGRLNKGSNHTDTSQSSTAVSALSESQDETRVKKKEYDRQKEVKGIGVPWWMWTIGIIAIILLGYQIVQRIKSKLRPF